MTDSDDSPPPFEAGSAGDDGGDGEWNPDEMEVEATFDGDGATGGAAEVATKPGEFITEDYWFEGEQEISTTPGTPFLWAMSAAGLYASSFVFAAVGLLFVAPGAANVYVEYVLNMAFFLPYPMIAYIAAGLGLEIYLYQGDGDLPETALPTALLLPVVLHVSLFFVEWIHTGYTEATLADLFAANPVLSQLVLWPPVIVGSIFAMIVYRTTVGKRDQDSDSFVEFA